MVTILRSSKKVLSEPLPTPDVLGRENHTAAHLESLRAALIADIAGLTLQECDVVKALVDILLKVRMDFPLVDGAASS
jgi:hypothetical protein